MAKKNKATAIVTDAQGALIAEINEPKFTTIPVDFETKADVIWLCIATGGSKRSQGAMVKKIVKEAKAQMQEKMQKVE